MSWTSVVVAGYVASQPQRRSTHRGTEMVSFQVEYGYRLRNRLDGWRENPSRFCPWP